jgi:hypothetical protein
VIHAIILGFGIGIGLFLWHFVAGFYTAWADGRRHRRYMQLLYPQPQLTPVQPSRQPTPPPPPPAPVVPINWGDMLWGISLAVVPLVLLFLLPALLFGR